MSSSSYSLGKKFEFYINRFENNTLHISQIIDFKNNNSQHNSTIPIINLNHNNNNNNNSTIFFYDSPGAAKYIIIVVLVYAFAIIFFIGSQVRSTQKSADDFDDINAVKVMRDMETQIFTKEVLGKFVITLILTINIFFTFCFFL
jgi:hypothetical protein